ncbi:MAG: hypothetical protein MI919_39090 [Holophagales bacterium]|nr:hypothetical protein [Holophagales bacterium]
MSPIPMPLRNPYTLLLLAALALLLSSPALASGCGELCTDDTCEDVGDPDVGCVQERQYCLDLLCRAATPASCPTEVEDLSSRVAEALDGVDFADRDAVARALDALGTPVRLMVKGELIYESASFQLERELLRQARMGPTVRLAEAPVETDTPARN